MGLPIIHHVSRYHVSRYHVSRYHVSRYHVLRYHVSRANLFQQQIYNLNNRRPIYLFGLRHGCFSCSE
jgi:hypothetical protein